jgi:hypothetical protein
MRVSCDVSRRFSTLPRKPSEAQHGPYFYSLLPGRKFSRSHEVGSPLARENSGPGCSMHRPPPAGMCRNVPVARGDRGRRWQLRGPLRWTSRLALGSSGEGSGAPAIRNAAHSSRYRRAASSRCEARAALGGALSYARAPPPARSHERGSTATRRATQLQSDETERVLSPAVVLELTTKRRGRAACAPGCHADRGPRDSALRSAGEA